METLRDAYLDTSYLATAVTLTRLDDVFVSTPRGVCVTADGILIDETARVAREIDPSLADVPFISVSDNAFTPGRSAVVSDPVLHCFHGAAGAYGHFLFDVLPIVALFQESILAGRLKVLVPPFPRWGFRALRTLGIRRNHVVLARYNPVRCDNILISDTLTTLNTFLPNPELCMAPAKALGVDITTR